MKIVIIGGVAAGTSAAAKARRVNPEAEIILFEKDNDISYAGCGLPYYISGVIPERGRVVINTPGEFSRKYNVLVRVRHEVTAIDPDNRRISYRNLDSGEEGFCNYDHLIISTGASPVHPPIPGIDLGNIFRLRTVSDADRIRDAIKEGSVQRATVIGGGLIGLETAEAFHRLGLEVTVVEKLPQLLPQYSREMAQIVEEHLKDREIRVILDDGVKEFGGNKIVKRVYTEKGEKLDTDLVLMSIGVRPNTSLAGSAGIKIGPTGAIAVNQKMETSVPGIYAAGDCAESIDLLTGLPVWVPLGSTANKQGRVAGENAAGGQYRHRGILRTGITKVFDLTAAKTGLSIQEAEESGFDPVEVIVTASNHAGYYPGVSKLNIRGIFDRKSGRLLGAEIVGGEGTDKRIDVLSTAIYSGLTAADLFQIDLAYAPPYSSPKDPVALLGMIAEKKL